MKTPAWHLPWKTMSDPPHALLDLLRGCNITCTACYNQSPAHVKTLEEIEKELCTLMAHRKLQSVSLVGGEVTLHPKLCEIVSLVKSYGLCVEIFTNGLLLDPSLLERLAEAGTDVIFLHIDSGQNRPDIAPPASPSELSRLAHRKAALIASHGLDAGLAITAYKNHSEEVVTAIKTVLNSPFLNYLLVTCHRDLSGLESIQGNLYTGMRGKFRDRATPVADGMTMEELSDLLQTRLRFQPFACIGSNINDKDPRWLSYLIATLHRDEVLKDSLYMKASLCERFFLAWSHFKTGRYPMYNRQNETRSRMQLFLNALTGGRFFPTLAFLAKIRRDGLHLHLKRLLFQCPAFVTKDGCVIHCRNCPDAVVKHGTLVPVCICDYVHAPEGTS